ncbi:type VII secretion integral membrane protein EccD [Rhizocola hellebori]|uniref:Type VII secretion integral membrane protein EccD n=1 Tax=Rhizocola hellebori TaxID=1392758 RepID=A0A8J3QIH5_9ACTN|nr:type VII secretion integral membrane protein EccD [Rhizocola hellebori]GIH10637.1 type VII secretion integral membrane protein EccD [Rhizocola hellebori]
MTSVLNDAMSRVTIVAPTVRVDLALPVEVPLVHLLPTLLRYVGADAAKESEAAGGWSLARLGQAPFNPERSLSQLQVRDGELLYLQQRDEAATEAVFDDVVDAIATSQQRAGVWQSASAQPFGLVTGVLMLAGGLAALILSGAPLQLPGIGALSCAVLLILAGVAAGQTKNPRVSLVLTLFAVLYSAVGGLMILAGDKAITQLGVPHVLVAGTVATVAAAITGLVVRPHGPVMLAVGAGFAALALGAELSLLTGLSPAACAAIIAVLALAVLPSLPMLAFRMAHLPMPSVPTGPRDVREDDDSIDTSAALRRSNRAATLLAAMIGGFAVVESGAAFVIGIDGALPGLLLAGVLTALLWSRARAFHLLWQRLPLLGGGLVGLAGVLIGADLTLSGNARVATMVFLFGAVASAAFVKALDGTQRRSSPVWGRTVDLAEAALTVAVVPLTAWLCQLFAWMQSAT